MTIGPKLNHYSIINITNIFIQCSKICLLYPRIGAHIIQNYLQELFPIYMILNVYLLPSPNFYN